MAAPKILRQVAGRIKELATIATSAGAGDADKVPATNASGILDPTLINAKNTSAGAGDANKIPMLDSTGRLDTTFMPVGIAADTAVILASEALSAGNLVNVYNNAGTPNVRKADATAEGKEAHGFVLAAVSLGANATVYFEGRNTQLASLTPGAFQFLSTTPGTVQATAPLGSGNVVQQVGNAVSATSMDFEPQPTITLA